MAKLASLLIAVLLAVMYLKPSSSKPTHQPNASPELMMQDKSAEDEFARQASEALDSTLLLLKDGINNLVHDSTKLTNMFSNLTDSIMKLAPQGQVLSTVDSQLRLHNLVAQANRSFSSGLFVMDD